MYINIFIKLHEFYARSLLYKSYFVPEYRDMDNATKKPWLFYKTNRQ